MGLFSAKEGYQKSDFEIASDCALAIVELWNKELADNFGFKVGVSAPSLEECCKMGVELFDEEPRYFSNPPGPFKRVAVFLVLGCLYPFFDFQKSPKARRRDANPSDDYERRVWHVRLLVTMLPQLFSRLKVNIDGKWEELTWAGFPSDHYQLEFMNILKWLDNLEELRLAISRSIGWEEFAKKRLARMVMATSLALEASPIMLRQLKENHYVAGFRVVCPSSIMSKRRILISWNSLEIN